MTRYAIVEDGGRQHRVEEGQQLEIDYRQADPGAELRLEKVLAYRDENGLQLGHPTLDSVIVTATVLGETQGEKIIVQKFRRRANYRRKKGHRQRYTVVQIAKIDAW